MATITGIELTDHPWVDNGFADLAEHVTRDDALLDALARQYAAQATAPTVEDFLLVWLPCLLYDIGYAGVDAPAELDLATDAGIRRALWLAHVIGWYVGVYSRTAFRLGGYIFVTTDLTPEVLSGTIAAADRARRAALGSDDDALAFTVQSLYGDLPPGPLPPAPEMLLFGPGLGVGEVSWYAYDLGFIDSICTTNHPAAVPAEPDYVTYTEHATTPAGLVDAAWKIGDAPFLATVRARYAALGVADDRARARFDAALQDPNEPDEPSKRLLGLQDRMAAQGNMIWSGPPFPGPDVTVFTVEQYHAFRTASAYYVQCNQANAMAALVAHATEDAALARTEAALSGVFHYLIDNSMNGAFDTHADGAASMADALPRFRT